MLIDFDRYFQPPPEPKLLSQHEVQALVLHLMRGREIRAVQLLSGGYRNQNYLIDFGSDKAVLRVSSDLTAASKEMILLERLSRFLPVPKILGQRQTSAHVFMLLEYIDGTMPSLLPADLPVQDYESLGASIGAVLAKIHQVHFEQSGFLDADLKIIDPHANLGDTWLAYMREVLYGKRAEAHLGKELSQRVLAFLNQHETDFREVMPVNRLVHSDFNLKNLLVREKEGWWQVRAVLDWEFAHSGSPLVDLGNFFRFEQLLPVELFSGFLQTYQEQAGALPSNWRLLSRLFDLAAMCNFIDAQDYRPVTLATARTVVEDTLKQFG